MAASTPSLNPRTNPSILVTGTTGNVGRELVARLTDRGARPRCLVRRPGDAPDGVPAVVGDLTDPTSLRAALDGIDVVFVIWPLLETAAADALAVELAAASPHVVYLSSTAIRDGAARQSDPIVRVHAEMEALLRTAVDRLTVVRSDTLASNARGWAAQVRAANLVTGPDIAPTAVVDERDVADAVARILLGRPDGSDDPYLLTGPEVLGRADQVAILGAALGRELRFEAVPVEVARERMLADGRPAHLVDALLAASRHRPASTLVTDQVERLTGRPARGFGQWAADHAAEYG